MRIELHASPADVLRAIGKLPPAKIPQMLAAPKHKPKPVPAQCECDWCGQDRG
jgi:hypothetical protein